MNEDRAPGEAGAATGAAAGAAAGAEAAAGGARLAGGARGAMAGGVAALAVLLGMALVFGLRVGPLSEAPAVAPEAGAVPETAAGEAARPVGLMATPQDGTGSAAPSEAPAERAVAAAPEASDPAAADAAAPGAAPEAASATTANAADVARFDQLRASADGMITLAGRAEPGATVEVLLDGQVIDRVTALAGGSFASVADAGAAVAGRLLTVRVTGADGVARESAASVILDPGADPGAGAPAVVVDAAEGARVLAAADPAQLVIDTFTASETAAGGVISGRGAPAGAMIRAYLDGAEAGLTVPLADGSWMIALPNMDPGTHLLRIDALDAAGKVLARAETEVLKPAAAAVAAFASAASSEVASPEVATAEAEPSGAGAEAPTAEAVTVSAEAQAPGAEAVTAPAAAGEVAVAAAAPAATAPPAAEPARAAAPAAASEASAATDAAPAAPPAPDATPAAPARLRQIEVRPGDTLWAIAGARYGDPLLYVQVFRANAGQIRDPDKIYPGQVFTLPE